MPNTRALARPPFCPNPRCDSRLSSTPWRFKKKGFFERSHHPYRVQRYVCHHCKRNFSSQTFSTTYWLRHTGLLETLFHRLVGGSCLRQISRELGVTHRTLQLQSERLGRHCLLFHELLRPRTAPHEPLVLDGFRTFEHSQYWPFDLNLLIGTSHFVYGMGEAELRRSGTMRPSQRRKRAFLCGSGRRRDYSRRPPTPPGIRFRTTAVPVNITFVVKRRLKFIKHPTIPYGYCPLLPVSGPIRASALNLQRSSTSQHSQVQPFSCR